MSASAAPADCCAVVVVLAGGESLLQCLDSVASAGLSAILVGPSEQIEEGRLRHAAVTGRILSAANVPRRRALGVARARTEWVVLLEDTGRLDASWRSALRELAALPASAAAAAGPVSVCNRLEPRGIALGCVEYGEFAAARFPEAARVTRLHGLCTAYRRRALGHGAELLIDTEVQGSLLAAGHSMHLIPALHVRFGAFDPRAATFASRRAHGRIYGSIQRTRLSPARRCIAALLCAVLPALLLVRAARGLPRQSRAAFTIWYRLLELTSGWAAGEFTGLLAGRGRALEAWR